MSVPKATVGGLHGGIRSEKKTLERKLVHGNWKT